MQKESIFSQWQKSSPSSQERLSLLKQIDIADWDKLIDSNEQEKYHLQNDEFLIYADKTAGYIPIVVQVIICILFFIGVLIELCLDFVEKYQIVNIKIIEDNEIIIHAYGLIFIFIIAVSLIVYEKFFDRYIYQ